jgi:hypothetical protein
VRFKAPGGAPRVASIGALQFNRLELAAPDNVDRISADLPVESQGQTIDEFDAGFQKLLASF